MNTTLLLLPGMDGTDVFFRPLIEALPPSVRTIVVSLPTTGGSGYADLLDYVRQKVAQLSDFYVLGSSFSGPLAVLLAASEPERVRGIILSATFITSPRPRLSQFRFLMRGPVVGTTRFLRRLPIWFGRSKQDPFRIAKAETWTRVSSGTLAARIRILLAVDVRSELNRCRQPTLCVTFDDDEAVPREKAQEILREAQNAKSVNLSGPHLAMVLNPTPLAQEIEKFINETGL
ncbi:MAG: alpha/beta hydrolase [Verrucomicrobiae bacterium]|nr:alpha/beta hydrolase [Verrucomicrobiae bacterium]